MKTYLGALLSIIVLGIVGCSRPDKSTIVASVPSPRPDLFYTVETSGEGPMVSRSTDVYANLRDGKKVRRVLVLQGLFLQISSITWSAEDDVTLCIAPGGITSIFRNQIFLHYEDYDVPVHNHLAEKCDTPSPKAGS